MLRPLDPKSDPQSLVYRVDQLSCALAFAGFPLRKVKLNVSSHSVICVLGKFSVFANIMNNFPNVVLA